MLGNGVCESACNTHECGFDEGDCQCNPGCSNLDFPSCKASCLVPACNYANYGTAGGCDDPFLLALTWATQALEASYTAQFSMDACLLSDPLCTVQKMRSFWDLQDCHGPGDDEDGICQTKECAFGLGFCMHSLDISCVRGFGKSALECFECKAGYVRLFSMCLLHCPRKYEANGEGICVPRKDISTMDAPGVIFAANSKVEGQGSLSQPYGTMGLAMLGCWERYTTVYLLGHQVMLALNSSSVNPEVLANRRSPATGFSFVRIASLTCAMQQTERCSPGYTELNIIHPLSLTVNYTLLIEQVILTSEKLFEGLSVEYCPNLLLVEGVWWQDNGEQASSDHITAAGLCTAFQDYSAIILEKGGVVTFREVEIEALAIQARAIVEIRRGNLVFENVHIADVHTSRSQNKGGVVLQDRSCLEQTCGSFTFINGTVSRLNNGLKYVEGLLLTPFLYSTSMSSVLISNVAFEHNLVVDTLASTEKLSPTALLYLEAFYSLTLTNCTFLSNFVTGGLLVVSSTVILPKLFDAHNVAYMYTYSHITLTGLLFHSNLAECSLVTLNFQRDVLNVNISQVWLVSNAVEGYALLAIQSDWAATHALVWGEMRTVVNTTDGTKANLWIAPRYVSIVNVTITKTMSAASHLIVENCANIKLNNLSLAESGDLEVDVLNKTFQTYTSGPDVLSNDPPWFPGPSACAHFIYLRGNIQLSLQHISFTANFCKQGICGVYIPSASGNVSVSDFTVRDNICTSSNGSALTTLGDMSVRVTGVTAVNNRNWEGGVLSFRVNAEVELQDSLFQDNVGVNGAAVACFTVRSLSAVRLAFKNNSAQDSAGGGLYIRTGSGNTSDFLFSDCDFERNQAEKGGALIFQASNEVPVALHLSSCHFRHNSATYGAALSLDVGLNLHPGSSIKDCSFAYHASDYGVLSLSYKKGALTVSKCSFQRNSGQNAAAVFLQSESSTQTTFTEAQFTDNYGATTLLKVSSRFNASISTRSCVFSGNAKGDVLMEGGLWQDWNTTFALSFETEFHLSAGAVAVLTGTTIRDNYDRYQGGAVHLLTGATLRCDGCQFLNNSAGHSGGAIYAEQDSTVVLRNSLFRFNRAAENGAVLQLISSVKTTSLIESCTIELNSVGKQGTIFAQSSSLALSNVTLRSNEGSECPGVVLIISALQVYKSEFSAQRGAQAAFLLALTSSNVSISLSHFWDGVAGEGGSISLVSSVLTMADTTLRALLGRAIFANGDCYISLSRVQATHVIQKWEGSLVGVLYSTLIVSHCDFSDFRDVGIYSSLMFEVVIEDSSFVRGEGKSGGAFQCYQCQKVRVERTVFADLKAEVGGAISLLAQDSFLGLVAITDSSFVRNSATKGGALWVSNYEMLIADSLFQDNQASEGGAMKLDCLAEDTCSYIISSSRFNNNSAESQGGAIVWTGAKPRLVNLNFSNNAATYGPDVASYPIRLALEPTPGRPPDPVISNYPTGQLTNTAIQLSVRDHYDQVYRMDNTSVVVLSAFNTNSFILGTFKVTAVQGYFLFDSFTVYGQPGSLLNVTASSTVIEAQHANESISSLVLSFELRECIPGEVTTLYSCEKCVAGTYSLEPSTPCLSCLANAQCWGNLTVTPDAGFWRSSEHSPVIRACPNKKACLGGVVEGLPLNMTGYCEVGYQGNLCQSCQSNYSHIDKNVCAKCPELNKNAARLAFLALALVLILALMVLLTFRASVRPNAESSILIKIMTNYLQLVTLVVGFKLRWPQEVEDAFTAQNAVGGASEQLFSFDCLIGAYGSQADTYYWKIAIMALMPLLLISASVLFWVAAACIKRNWRLVRQECLATIVIIFFLIEPNLVDSLFSLFSCQEIETGEYWLTVDLNIKCWDRIHMKYMLAVGLPGIIVWVLGVPLGCLVVLTRYRRRQDEIWMKMQYGFLMSKYRRHCFYWEFVILYRKVLIITCAVFMTNSIPQQALTIQVILLLSFFLQLHVKPYTTWQLNQMETLAILVADVTIYCGLYYLTLQLSLTAAWLLFIFIVAANLAFLFAWLRMLVRLSWSAVSRLFPVLNFLLRPDYCYDKGMEHWIQINIKGSTPEVAAFPMSLILCMRRMLRQTLPLLPQVASPRYTPRRLADLNATSLQTENYLRSKPLV